MANDHGEMARERTYFKQISLFRERYIYVARGTGAAWQCYMYVYSVPRLDAPRGEDSPLFSAWGSFEFKRFKAISQGVARRIVGPRTPIDRRRFFLSFLSAAALDPFLLFSPLSPVTIVTYCELLGEPCRLAERGSACPFRRGKFRAT